MLAQNTGFFGIGLFGLYAWVALCGVIFFLYPILQSHGTDARIQYFIFFVRVFLIFCLGTLFGLLVDLWLRPKDLHELSLAAFLFIVPAFTVGLATFAVGCAVRAACHGRN
jgi:hypothetical protein